MKTIFLQMILWLISLRLKVWTVKSSYEFNTLTLWSLYCFPILTCILWFLFLFHLSNLLVIVSGTEIKCTGVCSFKKYIVHSWHDCSMKHLDLNLLSSFSDIPRAWLLFSKSSQGSRRLLELQSPIYIPSFCNPGPQEYKAGKTWRNLFLEVPQLFMGHWCAITGITILGRLVNTIV